MMLEPREYDRGNFVNIHAIDFVNSLRGWEVGDGVWFTANGGEPWTNPRSG